MYKKKLHTWIKIFIISHELDKRYKMTTFFGTSSESRNQIPPPFPPPLQSSINGKITKTMKNLWKRTIGWSKKWKWTQAYKNEANFHYILITLKIYPPPLLHNILIYRSSIGNEGLNKSISWHMEDQRSIHLLLDREKSIYFIFLSIKPDVHRW